MRAGVREGDRIIKVSAPPSGRLPAASCLAPGWLAAVLGAVPREDPRNVGTSPREPHPRPFLTLSNQLLEWFYFPI